MGATWGTNDTIYFIPDRTSELWSVSANGGTPQQVVSIDIEANQTRFRWPQMLPDGKTILVTESKGYGGSDARIVSVSLETGKAKTLIEEGMDARYSPSGHMIFSRAGSLLAVPFDLESLETLGPPITVLDRVRVMTGFADYALSRDGSLVYVTQEDIPPSALARVNRDGTSQIIAEDQRFFSPRLSPDGNRLLVSIMEKPELSDSWIYDLTRDTMTRVTFEVNQNAARSSTPAIWTPDGKRVTFGTRREEDSQMQIYGMSADGSGQAERLTPSGGRFPTANSWTPDGKVLAFSEVSFGSGIDIWTLSLQNDPRLQPFLRTDFWENHAMFSPDGRWIAYTSNESGQCEVYGRPYPGPGERIQISTHGGVQPVWARDGRELFYFQSTGFTSSGNPLMAVPIEPGQTFVAGQPSMVLEGDYDMGIGFSSNYDVSPDGKSFVMIKRTAEPPREIHVVLNWFDGLKRLAPTEND